MYCCAKRTFSAGAAEEKVEHQSSAVIEGLDDNHAKNIMLKWMNNTFCELLQTNTCEVWYCYPRTFSC